MPDLYDILGVMRDADVKAIRKAYRKASKGAHPDTGGTAEKFRAVSLALAVLSDPLRRKVYDETGKIEDKPVDNAQSELMGVVSQLLDAVLQSLDQQSIPYETADLVQRMKRIAQERHTQMREQLKGMKDGVARQRKLLKRFKRKAKGSEENLMEAMVSGRIAWLEGQYAMVNKHIDNMRKAELFISEYSFDAEKMDRQAVNNMFVTFVHHL